MSRRPSEANVNPHPIRTGVVGRAELKVEEVDTAEAMHSGDVKVLATPRLIALCEEASCRCIAADLTSGKTSVATRVQFDHLAPAAIGDTVTAEATLAKVEGRRLIFTLVATVAAPGRDGLVGAGRLTRVVVDREAFMLKAGEPPRP